MFYCCSGVSRASLCDPGFRHTSPLRSRGLFSWLGRHMGRQPGAEPSLWHRGDCSLAATSLHFYNSLILCLSTSTFWAATTYSSYRNLLLGFPGGARGKEPSCQCRRCKSCRFDPWVGKIPWRRAWQPASVFFPGESPWTEEPGGLQSIGLQRVGHDWSDLARSMHILLIPQLQFNFKESFKSWIVVKYTQHQIYHLTISKCTSGVFSSLHIVVQPISRSLFILQNWNSEPLSPRGPQTPDSNAWWYEVELVQ